MYSSITIANHFINLAQKEGVVITPMKIIKLVYISHGWYLGLTGKNLIPESVQAWRYGPVVTSVYHEFKSYGDNNIISLGKDSSGKYNLPEDTDIKTFLDGVWNIYKIYDGLQLSTLTHMAGSPWDKVFNNPSNKDQPCLLIPNDVIKEHYINKSNGGEIAC